VRRAPNLAVTALLLLGASPAHAQAPGSPATVRVAVGVHPASVTGGDPFEVAVRVTVGEGARVLFPDVGGGDALQALDPVRAAAPSEAGEHTAVYGLVAWRPGALPETTVSVGVVFGADTARYRVRLPLPEVESVLPAGDTVPPPRPAKAVLPLEQATPASWLWLLLLLALLAALAVAWSAWRARRRRPPAPVRRASPRERALAELDAALAGSDLQNGELRAFHSAVAHAVRRYLAELSPAWGADLTTSELLGRIRSSRSVGRAEADRLRSLLQHADRAKFAPERVAPAEAQRFWESARAWVASFPEAAESGPRATEEAA
jgi:hypothetical protein